MSGNIIDLIIITNTKKDINQNHMLMKITR